MEDIEVRVDDLSSGHVIGLLQEHLDEMRKITPRGSVHALDRDALNSADLTFWSAWIDGEIAGCGALREIDATSGEIKSMRTDQKHRNKGVASRVLAAIESEARRRGYEVLYLETGAVQGFEAARALYRKYGYVPCAPFADYKEDLNSMFLSKEL